MADGRKNNGGHPTNGGRKPKSEEQNLVEKLKPYEDETIAVLTKAAKEGKSWAVKMYFEYMYGKAIETKELKVTKDLPIFGDDV
jgi:hypothetical protein